MFVKQDLVIEEKLSTAITQKLTSECGNDGKSADPKI